MIVELEHGCRIIDVQPYAAHDPAARGTWSCTRCGEDHPARRSVLATLRRTHDGGVLRAVLCRDCAETIPADVTDGAHPATRGRAT